MKTLVKLFASQTPFVVETSKEKVPYGDGEAYLLKLKTDVPDDYPTKSNWEELDTMSTKPMDAETP